MRSIVTRLAFVLVSLFFAQAAIGQPEAMPTIESKVSGLEKIDGFVPLYWDDATGSMWMEIEHFDGEILYANGLTAGLGSNDIGLDRGQNGGSRLVRFERIGPVVRNVPPAFVLRYRGVRP